MRRPSPPRALVDLFVVPDGTRVETPSRRASLATPGGTITLAVRPGETLYVLAMNVATASDATVSVEVAAQPEVDPEPPGGEDPPLDASSGRASLGRLRGYAATIRRVKPAEGRDGTDQRWQYQASLVSGNALLSIQADVSVRAVCPKYDEDARKRFAQFVAETEGLIGSLTLELDPRAPEWPRRALG